MTLPTITLKISGSLLDAIATLADALAHVQAEANVVLVHGGGPQLDEALAKLEEPIEHHDGLRATSRQQAGIVQATLDGLGAQLATQLASHGIETHHVDSLQACLVAEKKRLPDGTDLGRVGTPAFVHEDRLAIEASVPVITPVGTDGTGPLNVNADEAAAAIAAQLDSHALVFATGVPGVLDAEGDPIAHLDPATALALVEEGTAEGGMQVKLEAALTALADGVQRVHVAPLDASMLQATTTQTPTPGTCITQRVEVVA